MNSEVENLREEQRFLNDDLSNMQMRWHSLREEKLKASSILHKVKKADEDLALLAEEKAQVEFDEKVADNSFNICCLAFLFLVFQTYLERIFCSNILSINY